MAKPHSTFRCTECGAEQPKWAGRCDSCSAWNSLVEEPILDKRRESGVGSRRSAALLGSTPPVRLGEVTGSSRERWKTGIAEFDFVLGGGIVPGSLVLVGGEPGIGKSTLLLQAAARLEKGGIRTLYVSGEESPDQLRLRADRLGTDAHAVHALGETRLESVVAHAAAMNAQVVFLDSIQTTYTDELEGAPGNVRQVR